MLISLIVKYIIDIFVLIKILYILVTIYQHKNLCIYIYGSFLTLKFLF